MMMGTKSLLFPPILFLCEGAVQAQESGTSPKESLGAGHGPSVNRAFVPIPGAYPNVKVIQGEAWEPAWPDSQREEEASKLRVNN